MYEYDYGDGWLHTVKLEGYMFREKEIKYPICIDGKNACPPEDCGGVDGYYNVIEILSDPGHHDHEDMRTWAITRAGHDISDFTSANPRIQNWLDGTKQPTVKQLEDFSKKVYLPFGFLFLPEPPTEELPIPYFRIQSGN